MYHPQREKYLAQLSVTVESVAASGYGEVFEGVLTDTEHYLGKQMLRELQTDRIDLGLR